MDLKRLLGILRDRWYWPVLGLVLGLAGAIAVVLTASTRYTAVTQVVIDTRMPDPIEGIVPGVPGNYMATQMQILASDRVADRVVTELALDKNASLVAQWRAETGGQESFNAWAAKLLQSGLQVEPAKDSNVLGIGFVSTDPSLAKLISNQFARAYVEVTVEMKVEPARQYASLFEEQAAGARDRLRAAESKLREYELSKGMLQGAGDRLDLESEKLSALQANLVAAESQAQEERSKSANAGDTSPDVMQSGVVQGLRGDIDRAEGKLAELGARLGHNNPAYQRAQSELATLRERLVQETGNVNQGAHTSSKVSSDKAAALRAEIAEQRHHVEQLQQNGDELAVLRSEKDSAQKYYDSLNARFTQSTLESRANQTNIYVLSPASQPTQPSFPKIPKLLLTGVALGLALGVALAAALELVQARIRSERDLVELLDLHFLGDVSSVRTSRWRWTRRPKAARQTTILAAAPPTEA